MFENTSQAMFIISFMVYRALPVLKIIASILMSLSVYRHAKSNNISRQGLWAVIAFGFPVLGRLAYCIYHRFIRKKNTEYLFEQSVPTNNRKGAILCVLSLLLSCVAGIITVAAVSTIGFAVVKSVVDDEPLWEHTCYDVHGNQYRDIYEVPLYDREGNVYSYEPEWIVAGNYIDQNSNQFNEDYCYLDSDGYFVYNETEFVPCKKCWCDYYYDSDGNKYYQLDGFSIYWDENGNIFESQGRTTIQLFDETGEY